MLFRSVTAAENLPPHCLLTGKVNQRTGSDGKAYAIQFEIRLPEDWNGRFLHQVNGGNDGVVVPAMGETMAVTITVSMAGGRPSSPNAAMMKSLFMGCFEPHMLGSADASALPPCRGGRQAAPRMKKRGPEAHVSQGSRLTLPRIARPVIPSQPRVGVCVAARNARAGACAPALVPPSSSRWGSSQSASA